MEATAFSPGHITGFFTIRDTPDSVLHKGSLGAGVSLTRGVRTHLKAVPASSTKVNVLFNGKPAAGAVVSERVLEYERFNKLFGKKKNHPVLWVVLSSSVLYYPVSFSPLAIC